MSLSAFCLPVQPCFCSESWCSGGGTLSFRRSLRHPPLSSRTITVFSHANIRLPGNLDRALRYVIVTPDLHRVHHSSRQPETDSNFSAVFPIWDIIFGTFRTETQAPHENMALGLPEVRDHRTNRLFWLLGSKWNWRGRKVIEKLRARTLRICDDG